MTAVRPDAPAGAPALGPPGDRPVDRPDELDDDARLHHAVRGRLTVAVGEVELVLAEPGVPDDVRAASAARVLAALAQVEALLARRAGAAP